MFYGISLGALVFVLEKMEVGNAYAIWASAGTALIAIIGMVFFKESMSAAKIVSISLIILGIIVLVAAALRLWDLGKVPISPDWDETALGYNAYSILHTGRDEYGKFLPIVLRSFDDYKPALYAYFTIPSIVIFGLNTFAVRLPSGVFGVLTVIATYFLLKGLLSKAKQSLP